MMPPRNSHTHCQAAQSHYSSQSLSKSVSEPTLGRKRKNTKDQQWLKNIGVLVVNWKFRALIENRQTKILITKKEN
jgi:hypothetical protein